MHISYHIISISNEDFKWVIREVIVIRGFPFEGKESSWKFGISIYQVEDELSMSSVEDELSMSS